MAPEKNNALTEAVYYILISLQSPLHGYGIMQGVEEMSGGRVRLAAGTLYGALSNMVDRKWIIEVSEEKNNRKKLYQITDLGNEVLLAEIERLEELLINGRKVIRGEGNE